MYAPMLEMLDGAGGAGELVGWIEDAGVIVVNGETGVSGGSPSSPRTPRPPRIACRT